MLPGIVITAASATQIQPWLRYQAKRSHFRHRQIPSRMATFAEAFSSIWAATAALAAAGHWDDTVFLLTWDDWGGYDDHVATPNVEHTPDGIQLGYGPRVPLLMFGGPVRAGIGHYNETSDPAGSGRAGLGRSRG